jgi:G3E family GTPase
VQYLKLRQIGLSDMVLLNKVDLVDAEQIEKAKAFISAYGSIDEEALTAQFEACISKAVVTVFPKS